MGKAPEKSTFELETDALVDLVARMRAMRKRVALPFLVVGAAVANLGAAAHATGFWPIFGVLPDNTYHVNKVTVVLSFVIPLLPVLALGLPVYLIFRERTRRAWRSEYGARGLEEAWLRSTPQRFP